jgi:penicillin-binding protein 1A
MYKNKYISKQEFEKSKALPLNIQFQREELKKGIAPYFRKYLERTLIASQPKRSDYGKSAISNKISRRFNCLGY